jgi:hypothetical protein
MKSALSRAAKIRLLVGTSLAVVTVPLSAQETNEAAGNTIGEIVVLVQEIEVDDSDTDPSMSHEQTSPSQVLPELMDESEDEVEEKINEFL